ncbi:DUF5606 domain-containing protein [Cyclobacteriaceae bacterium]|nr:DUF5606 domain-containing protein [Cyclobacteriaceae bacterium]
MKFTEIAALSGKGGLFKVINPTRTGVILESLDASKKRMIVGGKCQSICTFRNFDLCFGRSRIGSFVGSF